VAIKEFIIGPQNYWEEGYFSGDYTHPNVSKSFLECDIENIKGGRVVTGEYYLDNYIDGTYYHNNSMSFAMAVDAMIVQEATVGLQGYYSEGYYANGYYESRGSQFFLTAELESVGQTVEAEAVFSTQFSQVTLAGKSVEIILALSSEFTQTTVGSRSKDIDLFAFSEAAIAIQVNIIRDNNASLTAVFDIATDGRRFRDVAAAEDSQFDFDAIIERSRAFNIETQAAFSISADNDKIKDAESSIQSTASLTAIISHIEGADIVLNNFGTLTCQIDDRVRDQSVSMQAQFAQTAVNSRIRFAQSSQLAQLFQTAEPRRIRFGRATTQSQFTQTSVVQYFKGVGRVNLTSSTAFTANVYRAPRDNEYPKIQTRALLHMDSEPIVDEYTSTVVNGLGGTVYEGRFGNSIGQPITAIPSITNSNGLFTNLVYQPAWTIDFWFKAPILTYNYVTPSVAIFAIKGINDREDFNWGISYSQITLPSNGSSGSVNGRFASGGAVGPLTTYTFNTVTDGSVANEWRHVAITYEYLGERPAQGSGYYEYRTRVWVDGVAGTSVNQIISIDNTSNSLFLFPTLTNVPDRDGQGSFTRTFRGRVDEIRFEQGIAYTGNFTPPTQPYDPYLYYRQGAGRLDSRAVLTVNGLNLQFGAANLSAQFNKSITASRTRLGAANLSVIASRLIIATEVNRTTANLSAETQLIANGVKVTFLAADTSAVFNLTANSTRVRFGQSQMAVNTNLVVDADVIGSGRINLNAVFSQSTVNSRTRDFIPQLDSIAIQLTAAFKNATGTVLLESTTELTALVEKTTGDQIALEANTALVVVNDRIRFVSSSQASEFNLSTGGEKLQLADAELISTTQQTTNTDNSKITRTSAQLSTTLNLTASADRSRDTIVLQVSAGTLTCDNQVLRLAIVNLNSVSSATFVITNLVGVTANLSALSFQLSVGNVLNLDPALTYVIPQETREFQILPETRLYYIASESRELIILKG
jgi:hypothetical protein